jgi:hypothetical protein
VNGWIYDVGRGEVFDYDPDQGEFLPLLELPSSPG